MKYSGYKITKSGLVVRTKEKEPVSKDVVKKMSKAAKLSSYRWGQKPERWE
jgi:hypothetical protein